MPAPRSALKSSFSVSSCFLAFLECLHSSKKISLDMDRLAEAKEELGGELNDDTLQPMKISQKRDGNIFRCNATGAKKRLDSELL